MFDGAEGQRIEESRSGQADWQMWGPYLSERQWGTVREDYSADGASWEYFPHDHARSRAYRWGEDGIAGFSDNQQRLCLAIGLWNGQDPILKERMFGLSNSEGNHGEDVKDYYWYLDATPTHSYMKMLYKYPQSAFPYNRLVEENARRTRSDPEFELVDTGIFDDGRYFDVFVEYAKADPTDILMTITVHNRAPETALLHVLGQLWFRNLWSWKPDSTKPVIALVDDGSMRADRRRPGQYHFHCETDAEALFCDNETNVRRLYGEEADGYFKDGFDEYVVHGRPDAVNPDKRGTKAAYYHRIEVPGGGETSLRLRLCGDGCEAPWADFDEVLGRRRDEADEFYGQLQAALADPEARQVQRQALAGMIWSKQYYRYNVSRWLKGDPAQPAPPPERLDGRNTDWTHLNNHEVLSMPDTWEYPWYAAWDLAFHCIALSLVDAEFAKRQLLHLGRVWYQHPNGQLPAYEWDFSDVNPPVHAWAAWRVFQIDRKQRGDEGDLDFLERAFHKLILNFTWWVNRKDAEDRNIFQGGFLGLDNIGVFDRSQPLPTGGHINQSDATSWMAMYCLNLMRIALELALHNRVYEDTATKFFEHFLHIAQAMTDIAGEGIGLWDEEDEFYYDVLSAPGEIIPLKIRSMVGLIPLFAVETIEPEMLSRLPDFGYRLEWFLEHRPDLAALVSRWEEPGRGETRLLSLLRGHRMKRLLARMLDPKEFLSEYGVRALSRHHLDNPYTFRCGQSQMTVRYEPGESTTGLFGGNSNWRGPIWMPVNYLIIESLQKFHHYYGDDFLVECPTGSNMYTSILGVAQEVTRRLSGIFLRDEDGHRPLFGDCPRMQEDPHFCDNVLFYEYFHGDTGRGIGASHQTGWTGLIAKLLQPRRDEAPATFQYIPPPGPKY